MVDAASKRGKGCFLLVKDERGCAEWRRVSVSGGAGVNVNQVFEHNPSGVVLYSAKDMVYYGRGGDVRSRDFLRTILAAPWIPRDVDGVKVDVAVRNPNDGSFVVTTLFAGRYNLAGRLGQLLSDVGDAACKSGIAVAAIDAFLWLRNFLVNSGSCSVSPLYPVIGLLIGGLLYVLGLSLKCLFDRLYGTTPAAKIVDAEATA